MEDTKSGAELIAAERQRQITKEGWTPEHDDQHELAEMADAANCYLMRLYSKQVTGNERPPSLWPWAPEWWKPSDDPIRNLTKAGALIAAEIDRLQRIATKTV